MHESRANSLRISFGLIVAPMLALADQSVTFSLVGWACGHQTTAWLHVCHGASFVLAVFAAVMAWTTSVDKGRGPHGNGMNAQLRFLSPLAATVAGLSALAIAAMWMPTWMISTCAA